jgi:rsbT antagonist protein RsbS
VSENAVRIPIQHTRGCLVASIQVDLDDAVLASFQRELLARIESTRSTGVILDVSGVEIMDAHDFESLRRSCEMARIMGARPIMVGLRPGIVAALVDLDVATEGVEATIDMDDALRRLEPEEAAPEPTDVNHGPEDDDPVD